MNKAIVLLFLAALTLGAMAEKSARGDAEFVVRVVEASSDPAAANNAADRVPEELKNMLRYPRYAEVGIVILRGREVNFDIGGIRGEIDSRIVQPQGVPVIECEVEIRGSGEQEGREHSHRPMIETTATIKDGETIVLGASKAPGGTKAMIVLLTAKIVR